MISKTQRVFCILHLCVAFTALVWWVGYPFLGELYQIKVQKQVLEEVMGKHRPEYRELFMQLPAREQSEISQTFDHLVDQRNRSGRFLRSLSLLLFAISPFSRMWLVLSIALPVLFLVGNKGAGLAFFLLPVITLAFAVDNLQRGAVFNHSPFPTEKELVAAYLPKGLPKKTEDQRRALDSAFQNFLEDVYPSPHPRYSFLLERVRLLPTFSELEWNFFHKRKSPLLLAIYFFWDLFVCLKINQRLEGEKERLRRVSFF